MDATTTSPQVPSKFSDVCNLLYESKNKTFTPTLVRKNTIVKYAKLPNYEFKSKGKFYLSYIYYLQKMQLHIFYIIALLLTLK